MIRLDLDIFKTKWPTATSSHVKRISAMSNRKNPSQEHSVATKEVTLHKCGSKRQTLQKQTKSE